MKENGRQGTGFANLEVHAVSSGPPLGYVVSVAQSFCGRSWTIPSLPGRPDGPDRVVATEMRLWGGPPIGEFWARSLVLASPLGDSTGVEP